MSSIQEFDISRSSLDLSTEATAPCVPILPLAPGPMPIMVKLSALFVTSARALLFSRVECRSRSSAISLAAALVARSSKTSFFFLLTPSALSKTVVLHS